MKLYLTKFPKQSFSVLFMLSFLHTSLGWGQNLNMQNGTFTLGSTISCGGSFYDSGGASSGSLNTSPNENLTVTICPQPGQYAQIVFSSVSYNNGGSPSNQETFEYSLNGGTSWTVIASGSTPTINSSSPGSCITIHFQQNGSYQAANWVATMNCLSPPSNDEPCGAIALPVGVGACTYSTVSNLFGSVSNVLPEPGCGSFSQTASEDVWYSAVVPANGILTIQAVDAPAAGTMYPGIAIYSGSCSSLVHQECAYTISPTTPSSATYTGTPGETIYIRVWDYYDNMGSINICASTHANVASQIVTGNTQINCGSSYTFSDPGGNGNYSVNTSAFYTLCPSTPGQYVSVNFTNFSLGSGDYLVVMNGSSSQAPIIYEGSGTTIQSTITSSSTDGCLQFSFVSNSSIVSSGWSANVTCSSTPGNNTNNCSQQDCSGGCGTWICSDGQLPATNSVSIGSHELSSQTNGCFLNSYEVSSNWYYFQAENTGSIELSFDGPAGQDYDFAVYGPTTDNYIPCPSSGISPIRCSYSGAANPVGIGNGATDYYEEAGGDGWVAPLQVIAGETYALLVNIFQNGGPQPVITLGISGSGSLNCNPTVLGVTLKKFDAIKDGKSNFLNWITSNERNNDYFIVQRSENGLAWHQIGIVQGNGNSTSEHYYQFRDEQPIIPISYYRLIQVDFDGTENYSRIAEVNREGFIEEIVSEIYPNPSTEDFSFIVRDDLANEPIELVIRDNYGKLVQKNLINSNETKVHKVNTSELSSGIYHVEFVYRDYKYCQRFIKLN